MGFKKRRKSSRYRGSQTAKRGAKERTRHSGNRGGYGMAGTGKKAEQKKTLVLNLYGNDYFGKNKVLRKPVRTKLDSINLRDIMLRLASLKGKDSSVNLKGYKILGEGELKTKLLIKASAASKSAIEKVKKAGGEIIFIKTE